MSIKPIIVVTLFNRPRYTRILFDALSKCYGIKEYPILISIDGPESDVQKECAAIANEFVEKLKPLKQKISIVQHNVNRGIDLHKLWAIPEAFKQGDYVIFFEDDTGLAPTTLNYFVAMGEKFKDDESIASISGYNRFPAGEWITRKNNPYGIERCTGFVPWGWSVHKDRWEKMFSDDAAQYRADTGNQANGLFDHHWNGRGLGYIRPVVGQTNHIGWEGSQHTPSREFLMANEYAFFGAWQLELPDRPSAWE
jgi:hypothetical protein